MALAAGFVVVVSMQDQFLACGPAEPLPSQETEDAWATLIGSTTLGSNPDVMFELFNEPQNSAVTSATTNPRQETWPDWLSGGREIEPSATQQWAPYTPVGHQELVDYLRSTLNVTNVLIADGASNAENLAGVPILSDPGSSYQIAYAVHPYNYTGGQGEWDTRWGYLAGSYALIATEWDYQDSDCGRTKQTLAPVFLNYMRSSVNVGVLGHALDIFSGRLIADTSLDPTQCGTASPGSGYDFREDYLDTFPAPGAAAPTAPVILGSPQQTMASITLTWAAAYDSTYSSTDLSYAVYRDGQLAGTVPAGTTSFTDTGLSPGTTYTYTVTASDPAGNTSQPSAAFTQPTQKCPPPPAPSGLAATAESGTTVSLSWNAVIAPGAGCSVAGYLVETWWRGHRRPQWHHLHRRLGRIRHQVHLPGSGGGHGHRPGRRGGRHGHDAEGRRHNPSESRDQPDGHGHKLISCRCDVGPRKRPAKRRQALRDTAQRHPGGNRPSHVSHVQRHRPQRPHPLLLQSSDGQRRRPDRRVNRRQGHHPVGTPSRLGERGLLFACSAQGEGVAGTTAEFHPDGFRFEVLIDRGDAVFTAHARCVIAPGGDAGGDDAVGVDPYCAGLRILPATRWAAAACLPG